MTCYFAFPASDDLSQSSQKLLNNFESGAKEPQSTLFIHVSQLFSDEIVDALLLNIVRAADSNHSGAKILESFAGLIKKTVHALIRQILGKMDNKELQPLSAIIRQRKLILNHEGVDKDFISFTMPADFFAQFKAVLEAGSNGVRHPEQLLDCMLRFSDMSHQAFYEDSVRPLKLGFIGRKMVDMGSVAISKGSHSSIRSLIPTLAGEELKQFCEYFLSMLVEA